MSDADEFMARVMSNLDGGKDAEIDRLRAELRKAHEVIRPFAGIKMPSLQKTEIGYNRDGIRCCMSQMEIARKEAWDFIRRPMAPVSSPTGGE